MPPNLLVKSLLQELATNHPPVGNSAMLETARDHKVNDAGIVQNAGLGPLRWLLGMAGSCQMQDAGWV